MSTLTARTAKVNPMTIGKEMRDDAFGLMRRLHREYGDFILMPVVPGLRNVLIMAPELAYDILVEHPERYVKAELGKRLFRDSFGNGIFFSEGDFWKRQRKLAQPAFHHVRVNAYAEDMVAQTLQMLDKWRASGQVDIGKEMHALTLIIVVNALFHSDVSGLTDRVGDSMRALGEALAVQTTSVVHALLPAWVPTTLNRQKKQAARKIDEIVYQLIRERRKTGEDKGDLLSTFMLAKDEVTGESMSDSQLRDELMTMFIAGHETSANALAWVFVELARHPEIVQKLCAEIDSALAGRPPTLADLPNLAYTQKVIKEVMRFYPPATFITRQGIQDVQLGASTISKRDLINIMTFVIHRDPRWYPEPDQFDPERWTPEFEKSLPKCAYLPFGTGPRICIGNGFAMLEMQLVLATIAQRFDLSFVDGRDTVEPKISVTLGFKNPVLMAVKERMREATL